MSTVTTTSTSSNFQLIFNNALKAYEKRTKKDLRAHPLAAELQDCNSPSSILGVLHQLVQGHDQSLSGDDRWTKWLDPTVNVLYMLSERLGEGISLVISPAKVIFVGVGVLLSAAKDIRKFPETLIDIFGRIESFFQRLVIYTHVPSTKEMLDTITLVMVEVLTILAIATKEIKQGRIKKYWKTLIGQMDMEDALKKLDSLTQEEARMMAAEDLRATYTEHVRAAGVKVKVEEIIHGKETKDVVKQVEQNQLRESIHKWLSPPDPSTNHNIACGTYHKKNATWFFKGNTYQEWKSKGSLLWIHGKPGAGKSIFCSTVIEDIRVICDSGQASMAYFYFDFRNANKQSLRDLLSSLLTQLSARSSRRCDILSKFFWVHDYGKNRPSDIALTKCLEDMLALPDQGPIYLIIDALDESPITSGILSARERVLRLLKELVDLGLPDLHICVTSRPEIDIRNVIEPLTSLRMSLHDETGQKEDIADYVRSIVYSNADTNMKRWRKEDKEFVVKTLVERADGMFRWTFCQLEVLRDCLPSSVRRFLDELPESLDETYERVLREIKKPNRDHTQRLLQCLVVAIRPLRVEEIAEFLAINFNDAESIPKLNPDWRWEDQEQALLTSCSSLLAIVNTGYSRVVQFSHFSVKEYLTSERLATSRQDVSRYHITSETAHGIVAQACVSILLHLNDHDAANNAPLAVYAAEYWACHYQFGDVASRMKGVEDLFNLDKPNFSAWRRLYDIDLEPSSGSVFSQFTPIRKPSKKTPLYYAALCGLTNLVEQLMVKYPQHINAIGGYYMTPAVAALSRRHFQLAQILHCNKSSVEPRGFAGNTPLHSVAYYGDLEMVQVLLEYGADVNSENTSRTTPLSYASEEGHRNDPGVARLLIAYGADPNTRTMSGLTPLHKASTYRRVEIVRLLIEHGANVGAKDDRGRTPLDIATDRGHEEIVELLTEHVAK